MPFLPVHTENIGIYRGSAIAEHLTALAMALAIIPVVETEKRSAGGQPETTGKSRPAGRTMFLNGFLSFAG